jgi:hypothetical protein
MRKNSKVVGMDDNGSLWIFHGKTVKFRRRRSDAEAGRAPGREGIYKQTLEVRPMKRILVPILIGASTMAMLAGCSIDLRFGGGSKNSAAATTANNTANNNQHPVVQQTVGPTIGQQLLDLKKARDDGAISAQEYESEKTKLLNQK